MKNPNTKIKCLKITDERFRCGKTVCTKNTGNLEGFSCPGDKLSMVFCKCGQQKNDYKQCQDDGSCKKCSIEDGACGQDSDCCQFRNDSLDRENKISLHCTNDKCQKCIPTDHYNCNETLPCCRDEDGDKLTCSKLGDKKACLYS